MICPKCKSNLKFIVIGPDDTGEFRCLCGLVFKSATYQLPVQWEIDSIYNMVYNKESPNEI